MKITPPLSSRFTAAGGIISPPGNPLELGAAIDRDHRTLNWHPCRLPRSEFGSPELNSRRDHFATPSVGAGSGRRRMPKRPVVPFMIVSSLESIKSHSCLFNKLHRFDRTFGRMHDLEGVTAEFEAGFRLGDSFHMLDDQAIQGLGAVSGQLPV